MRCMRRSAVLTIALVVLLTRGGPAAPRAGGADAYRPHVDPADFVAAVDHPYFPLVPGTTFRYRQWSGRDSSDDVVEVTSETKMILGVRCTVVHDRATRHGALLEETLDWYAQDRRGNVWYFGEATREFGPGGRIDTGGSWEAGVEGARPGILLPGKPVLGATVRQEYLAGRAEDMGRIVALADSVRVPFGAFRGCLRTREWSPLERGSESKWYARGVGLVRSRTSAGETSVLVAVERR